MAEETRPIEIPLDATINGKAVRFRQRLPQQDANTLMGLVNAASIEDTRSMVAVLTKTVESWEFAGDPRETKSYNQLDIFDEIVPLYNASDDYLSARLARLAQLKN